jgi:hypothetical protein
MRPNPYSAVVLQRLTSLGLERIPTPALALIEGQMVAALGKIASQRITVASVSRAILRAHSASASHGQHAPAPTVDAVVNISPAGA